MLPLRSGSISGLDQDTIGGFNAMLARQKKEKGRALVSTVLFDDDTRVLHDRVDIQKVRPMTEDDYFVGSCTALLDAIAAARSYGIREDNAVRYECDVSGTALNFEAVSMAVECVRSGKKLDASWKSKVQKDFKKRGRK